MANVDWDRVEEIFQAALAAPAEERRALVARAAAGDAALAAEVVSLLAAHDDSRTGAFLEPLALSPPLDEPPGPEGSRIGPYELVRELGRGGMGEVYLGRRADGVFQHQVAVKLARAAVPGAELSRRLAAERAILATLHHPYIVTLLDGGTTTGGQPYLITEYIDGEPITVYVTSRRLPLDARLRLFREVCAGVHAAHLHGVVHRDLKPENILVTADGNPKILDFGIAKLLGGGLFDQTPTGGLPAPMTPSYASPEQLRGQAVTTASDVYALGVLLHELVTGARPYESRGRPLDEVLTEILNGQTTRPSAAAERRAGELPYEAARLRGDLDAIVLKAMRVEPEARYASADELSRDIDRFLDGQPIEAREPTLRYLVGKIVARHRAAAVAAALGLIGIVAALGLAVWQRQQAEASRAEAEQRFNDVRALANAVVFELHDAIEALPGSTAARQLLVARGLEYVDRLVQANPRDRDLRKELAAAYERLASVQGGPLRANLGDLDGALATLAKALAIRQSLAAEPGADPDDAVRLAEVVHMLGMLQRSRGDLAPATANLADAAARLEAIARLPSGRDVRDRLVRVYQLLAEVETLQGHTAAATAAVEKGIAIAEELVRASPDRDDLQLVLSNLYGEDSERLRQAGRLREAQARSQAQRSIQEALVARAPEQMQHSRALLFALDREGLLLVDLGEPAGAVRVHQRQLEVARALAARDARDRFAQIGVAVALRSVGQARVRAGDVAGGLTDLRAAVQAGERIVRDDPANGFARDGLAFSLLLAAEAMRALGHGWTGEACHALRESQRHWKRMQSQGALDRDATRNLQAVEAHLAACPDASGQAAPPQPRNQGTPSSEGDSRPAPLRSKTPVN